MARKFLYVFAALIMLVIGAAFAYRIWGAEIIRAAFVPGESFQAQTDVRAAAYQDAGMWVARPDKPGNPALWTPPGYRPGTRPRAAVFFINPTSYITPRGHWNAPAHADGDTEFRTALFVRSQASTFNEAGQVWAPRYRQASFGAFLTDKADAQAALDLAYRDVAAAFTVFLQQAGDRPIILAGHSQGALHLERLLRERVAGTPLARRIVAAYVVGWPISVTADLPRLGLPGCTRADQTGCILSWASFAEPADPALIIDNYDKTTGFTGAPRRGTAILCTNPLTGGAAAAAPAAANLGTLKPSADLSTATIERGRVPARCADRGFLLIGEGPDVGSYVLPGNNYHVYDYALFWANVRADAGRRLAAWR